MGRAGSDVGIEDDRMGIERNETTPSLLPVDHPRGRARTSARARHTTVLAPSSSVDTLAAVTALASLISRYALDDDVTVQLSARAVAVLTELRPAADGGNGMLVTIAMGEEPDLQTAARRLTAAIAAARASGSVGDATIAIDVGAPMPSAAGPEFSVCLTPGDDGLRCTIDSDPSLFDPSTVERFATCYSRLLKAALADPAVPLERLPLLDDAERQLIVHGWNATAEPRQGVQVIHRLIEAQVARTPDAVAVEFEGQTLTYRQLNARANGLARSLCERRVGTGATVGVCFERSLELLVAVLAIHKSGAAFLPLDPELPAERLSFMLRDAATHLVLTHREVAAVVKSIADDASVMLMHVERHAVERTDTAPNLGDRCTPEDLAYVMYTSGSTGRPKGVLIRHRSLCNHALWFSSRLDISPADRILQHASIGFDAAMAELFAPLVVGATVVFAGPRAHRDVLGIPEIVHGLRITVAQMVPSALRVAVSSDAFATCTGLRYLVSGGEALEASLASQARRVLPGLRLGNFYGPTEATVDASSYEVTTEAEDGTIIPIGRPVTNGYCRILDRHDALVPVGVPGELFLGGLGLADGYLNLPDRTAFRFVADPFLPGATMYRTGDLARYQADGNIEYLGRIDTQVKLRGYRIELAEVERPLLMDRRVREAAVVLREDTPGEPRLVAYVVRADAALTANQMRDVMRSQLPAYMLPEAYCFLDALPLTASAKLDRRALPAPEPIEFAHRDVIELTDPVERSLQEIWERVLGQRPIGPDDDFFVLGGHSLKAIRLLAEIERVHGIALRAPTLFEAPTIRTLAARLSETVPRDVTTIIPTHRTGTRIPLFFAPGAGGELFVLDALAKALGEDQPMYVLDMYVFGEIPMPGTTLTLADIAARMITDMRAIQPRGPYQLAGYSLGGNIVYEIAQQLQRAGEEIRLLALLDSDGPGYPLLQPFASRTISHLTHAFDLNALDGLRYLRTRFGNAFRLLRRPRETELSLYSDQDESSMVPAEMIEALERQLKPVLEAWERYVPQFYPGSVLIIRAEVRLQMIGVIDDDPQLGWGALIGGGVQLEPIACDHFSILHAANARRLASILTPHLDPQPMPRSRGEAVEQVGGGIRHETATA